VRVRPDGRCFIRLDELDSVTDGELYVDVDEADAQAIARCIERGFRINRRESAYRVPTSRGTGRIVPNGVAFLRADEADEARLRALDDVLRQDVPGTDGWCWDPQGFGEELRQPAFDPSTYIVAADALDGEYIGIARVWNNPKLPRLGFVGVVGTHRRLGIGHALLDRVFSVLAARGQSEVSTEIDDTNVASRALLAGFGARRCGGMIELRRAAG
jgi:ribosomal protein S18 acetylase RimI-like enzyme